jgi:uncharacterized membrane protein
VQEMQKSMSDKEREKIVKKIFESIVKVIIGISLFLGLGTYFLVCSSVFWLIIIVAILIYKF